MAQWFCASLRAVDARIESARVRRSRARSVSLMSRVESDRGRDDGEQTRHRRGVTRTRQNGSSANGGRLRAPNPTPARDDSDADELRDAPPADAHRPALSAAPSTIAGSARAWRSVAAAPDRLGGRLALADVGDHLRAGRPPWPRRAFELVGVALAPAPGQVVAARPSRGWPRRGSATPALPAWTCACSRSPSSSGVGGVA